MKNRPIVGPWLTMRLNFSCIVRGPALEILALTALSLMLIAPFLMAHHYQPIPTFFQEWTACLLGLVAALYLLHQHAAGTLKIPDICALPFCLLLLTLMQWSILPTASSTRLQLFALYLIWASLLAILGNHLARSIGLDKLSRWLAFAFLAGSLLESGTAALQLAGLEHEWLVLHAAGNGIRGNLAQANHFGNYLWLGIASAIYLHMRQWLRFPATLFALSLLIFFALLSASRSVWFYAGGLVALSLWAAHKWPEQAEFKRAKRIAFLALGIAVVFQCFIAKGWIGDFAINSGARLLATGGNDPIRLTLWQGAARIWFENPWIGAGLGQFTWHFYRHILDFGTTGLPGLPEHAHNLFLHLLAEGGLAATIPLLVVGGLWIYRLLRSSWTPPYWFFVACLLILGIHSGLEYPLWYSFFLGPAALMTGALSQRGFSLPINRHRQIILAGALALGCFSLLQLRHDYQRLEDTANLRFSPRTVENIGKHFQDAARGLKNSVFMPYLYLAGASAQSTDSAYLPDKLAVCEQALRFSVTPAFVFKCAEIQALAGQQQEALQTVRRAASAYPAAAAALIPEWQQQRENTDLIATLLPELEKTLRLSEQNLRRGPP